MPDTVTRNTLLNLPTPEPDARGVIALGTIVDAVRGATGYVINPPLTAFWESDARDRDEAHARFVALMAEWHGLVVGKYGRITPSEHVYLAGAKKVSATARLLETPRGIWMAGVSTSLKSASGGCGLELEDVHAYVDRATALRHTARMALRDFGWESGYRRINATLERLAEYELEDVA